MNRSMAKRIAAGLVLTTAASAGGYELRAYQDKSKPDAAIRRYIETKPWYDLGLGERQYRLLRKMYPATKGFDPVKEVIALEAELACLGGKCALPPSEIAQKIIPLHAEQLPQEFIEKPLRFFEEEDPRNRLWRTVLTANPNGTISINIRVVSYWAQHLSSDLDTYNDSELNIPSTDVISEEGLDMETMLLSRVAGNAAARVSNVPPLYPPRDF